MNKNFILIVDNDEATLEKFKNSLDQMDEPCEIITAESASSALALLKEYAFEVIITNYAINGVSSIKWIELIRSLQPNSRVILVADHHHDILETQSRRLQINQLLMKPIESEIFCQTVKKALMLDRISVGHPGVSFVSEERYQQVMEVLGDLANEIGSRHLLLSDAGGHIIARLGDEAGIDTDILVPLLGAGVSTLVEVGKHIDGDPEAINLLYREGKRDCIYAIYMGQKSLLIIVMGKESSRLGSIWYYAQQIAGKLQKIIRKAEKAIPHQLTETKVESAFENELDKLFKIDLNGDKNASDISVPPENVTETKPQKNPEKERPNPRLAQPLKPAKPINKSEGISFKQAVANGLISIDRMKELSRNNNQTNESKKA